MLKSMINPDLPVLRSTTKGESGKKTKVVFVMMLLVFASMIFASQSQVIEYDDSWAKAGFSLTQRSDTGVEVNFSIKEFILKDTRINGEDMQNVFLPNVFLPNNEGAPNLPGNGRFIALPQGAYAELRIISSRTETFSNIELAPAPRIPWDTDKGPLEYNKDEAIYSRNEFYPANPIQLGDKTQIRGVDVVMLGITPFQYNPVTKELLVYRDIQVEISFIGGNGHFGEDRLRSRWWDPLLRDMLLNEQSLLEMDYSNINSRTREGAEYLVICPDDPDFIAWADSIKVFRTKQGILTVVKTTTEVGGNTPAAIENYINDAYANWDPAPAAVLLLGDHGTTGNTVVSSIYSGFVSDHIYADVNNNMMADIILARMTAQNPTHLETMITKFLNYERTPPENPNYYDNPVTAMGYQSDRWFQLCSEIINGFWEYGLGKNPVRENDGYPNGQAPPSWSTNQNTQIIIDYFGPNGLGYVPATPAHLTDWGGNATRLNNDINSGAFMLQHRDHGSETGWSEPSYYISDLSGLQNEDLVFVFSINCLTGMFNWSGECFAEAFHRYTYNDQNAGALGIIAASQVSYSFVNDTYVWGMYDNMWPEFMPEFGTTPESRGVLPAFANAAGKYFLQGSNWPYNPQNKAVTYYLFHHHGDAFTTVYSEMPQNLTVVHDPVLISGLSFFEVTADEGSLIALSVEGELIGVVEGTGFPVSITIEPQIPPTVVDIVITKQNYYRYDEHIQVIPPSGPYVVFNEYVIDDAAGNANGVLDYGETVNLDMAVNNVGNQQAANVVVTISTSDTYVTVLDGTENYGNIPANTIVNIEDAFSFEVFNNVPDEHVILFDLEAVGQETWNSGFSIEAHAPVLEFYEFLVDDTASGNGDYLWDPGETVDIVVTLANNGSSDAFNVFGELTTSDPYVILNTTGAQPYGDMIFGNTAEQSFNATSDENTPEAHLAEFIIDITADLGITGSGTFATQIGGFLIEEYFDSWLPDGWSTTGGSNWGPGSGSNAGGTPPEAQFSWSPSTTAVQRLISLPVNTTGSATLELEFKHSVDHFSGAYELRLETTSDGGSTWNIVQTWPAQNMAATTENLVIDNNDVGSSTFQVAWVFDGYSWNINYWYVDNVILGGGTSAIIGTIAGHVNLTGGSGNVQDVLVSADEFSTNPDASGDYTLQVTPGTYDITAELIGYEPQTITGVVVEEGITTSGVDFTMEALSAPANLICIIMDYNDVHLEWDQPVTSRDVSFSSPTKALSTKLSSSDTKRIGTQQTDDLRDLIGYKVYRDTLIIQVISDPGVTTYDDLALAAGEYEYYIVAVYDVGESEASNIETVTITLPAPQNPQAVTQGQDILITWDAPPQRALSHYKVYRDFVLIAYNVTETSYLDENIPAGTYTYNIKAVYDGGYESEYSEGAVIEHVPVNAGDILIPIKTELAGNYPNPFNPETTINFALKEAGNVTIEVYNIRGEKVITLVNRYMEAAYHSVVWNGENSAGNNVSSGIYFYKMKAGGRYTSTRKMILMK